MTEQLLPCNLDAEKKVLGAMIRDRKAIPRARDILTPADFYQPSHQILYETMLAIDRSGRPVDLLILADALQRKGQITEAGGPLYLAELVNCVATSVNVQYHAGIVRDKAIRRRLIRNTQQLAADAPLEDLEVLQNRAYRQALALLPPDAKTGLRPIREFLQPCLDKTQERIAHAQQGRRGLKDIQTGLIDLDRFTGGWDRGELIVLGARPSEGKTSLACRIAEGVAERGGTVLFFSLETKAMGIVERLLHGRARFPLSASNTGAITGGDAGKLLEAAAWFDSLKIYIDDSRGLTPEQISARAERVKFEAGPLDLVIIDYLQLMNVPPDIRRCGLREAVTFLTNQCQILPERLDCPLLLLSQLTRDCERENRRPRLDDLRESGAIEQDASQVWLIHRPEGIGKADPGIREIIVAKNKTGPTGQVHLQYGPVFMRFECLDTALDPWERPAPDEEGINF